MQIWLILAVVGTAPIHVGNFPDMDICQAAAMSRQAPPRKSHQTTVNL
jgi:hypothetical protein